MTRKSLAIFSPLPPSRSGIADYCLEQIPFLARQWEVAVVIADDAPDPDPRPTGAEVFRLTDWLRDKKRDRATPRLYHVGNNPHHEFIYWQLHQRPGITVLHDYCLHHLVATLTLGRGKFYEYQQLMEHDHGQNGARMACHRLNYVFSEYQQFLLPLNGTVLEASKGVIVHSEFARRSILDRYAHMTVTHIPHHYAPPAEDVHCGSRAEARAILGLPEEKNIIVSLGFITPPKQIELSLQALAQVKHKVPPFEYWLVGEPSDAAHLNRSIRENGLEDHVRITGFVSTADFYRYIEASDLILNLRYPGAGETSGTLIRAMGMGRCAVVFDYQSFADYPEDVIVKLPLNTTDAEPLANAVEKLLNDTAYRRGKADAAAMYIGRHHAQDICAEHYSEFIMQNAPEYKGYQSGTGTVRQTVSHIEECASLLDILTAATMVEQYIGWIEDNKSREYALTHQRRWAKTITYIPKASPGMAVLEIGSYQVILPILRHELGFDYVAGTDYDPSGKEIFRKRTMPVRGDNEDYDYFLFNLEADPFPFEDGSFDLVLCCEVIEHMSVDPMFMISEINRILKDNGMLILTTPNIASARSIRAVLNGYAPYLYAAYNRNRSTDRHNIEYSPHEINALLTAGGFAISRLETAPCWEDAPDDILGLLRKNGYSTDLRDDNIIAVALKRTDYINRYPEQIYVPGQMVRRLSRLGPLIDE